MATANNEFKLTAPKIIEIDSSATTIWCCLSPAVSAVNMEIRWFKIRRFLANKSVFVYKNRQVTEGNGYEGRVSLFTEELERGNIRFLLRHFKDSDEGDYLCRVTDGDRTQKITIQIRTGSGTSSGYGSVSPPSEEESVPPPSKLTADVEVFIPELVDNDTEDKNINKYRFLCPHAGQFKCKLTNLVFEMDGTAEVLYRIVSWDKRYLHQKEPAGPLYSIECHERSISRLHLPHCETCTDVKLIVAHVTDGNMEILQPLTITKTHVIIDVQDLSLLGNLIEKLFNIYPIEAQVLLFYKKMTGNQSKLHVHIVPGNVPVVEVQKQNESNRYIETSSKCELTPGQKYKLYCTDAVNIQPKVWKFGRDYGPNYHITFEVFVNNEVDTITLGLLDEEDEEVWEPRQVLLTEAASTFSEQRSQAEPSQAEPSQAEPSQVTGSLKVDDGTRGKLKEQWQEHRKDNKYRDRFEEFLKDPDLKSLGNGKVFLCKKNLYKIGTEGTQLYIGMRDDGTEVAVKRLLKDNVEQPLREMKRLQELEHRNIIKYLTFTEDEDFVYLCLQLCEYDFEEYKISRKLDEAALKKVTKEVLLGLQAIHDAGIIHRDINPSNIFIDVQGTVRLADYGISRKINKDDIQAAGILVYYILSGGDQPFPVVEWNILSGNYNLDKITDVEAKDLIKRMLEHEPQQRLKFKEAVDHPYFWEDYERKDFLTKVGTRERYDKTRAMAKYQNFYQWKDEFEKQFGELDKKYEKPLLDNLCGLVRLLRNRQQHPKENFEPHNIHKSLFPDFYIYANQMANEMGWHKDNHWEEQVK